jgi:hypothetical protein
MNIEINIETLLFGNDTYTDLKASTITLHTYSGLLTALAVLFRNPFILLRGSL